MSACNRKLPSHHERFNNAYFSLESFDFICPPAFSHLPLSVSPMSLLSFIRSESTSSSLSLFFRSYSMQMTWELTEFIITSCIVQRTRWNKILWNCSVVTRDYLNFDVLIRQFLLLLCLFSFAPLLFSSLSLFFLPLPFLFKLSSSPLLSLLLSYSLEKRMQLMRKDSSHKTMFGYFLYI